MGSDKALLRLGRMSVIEHVVERVAGVVEDIYVVARDVNSYSFLGLPIIPDIEPDMGPLMGLYSGITSSKTPWVLAVACDTPFIESHLLEMMLARPLGAEIIAVEVDSQPQPLPALYSAGCAEVAWRLMSSGRRALRDLIAAVEVSIIPEEEVRRVDPELRSFLDIDTIEDLHRAEHLIDSGQ